MVTIFQTPYWFGHTELGLTPHNYVGSDYCHWIGAVRVCSAGKTKIRANGLAKVYSFQGGCRKTIIIHAFSTSLNRDKTINKTFSRSHIGQISFKNKLVSNDHRSFLSKHTEPRAFFRMTSKSTLQSLCSNNSLTGKNSTCIMQMCWKRHFPNFWQYYSFNFVWMWETLPALVNYQQWT